MAREYVTKKIGDKTWCIEEKTVLTQGLCYLLCGEEKAMLIDTGFGFPALENTVRKLTVLPIFVANTHGHVDHIGGNHFFGEVWMHEKDRELFQKHCDPSYTLNQATGGAPKPAKAIMGAMLKTRLTVDPSGDYHWFGDKETFHLGDRDVEVIPAPGHTAGSVCFLDRKNRMLFSGDTVCEKAVLLHFKGESCAPEVYRETMERLLALEYQFDTIWPGHHHYPLEKNYLLQYFACADGVVNGTANIIEGKGGKRAVYQDVSITLQ